ncbi:MAG: hypothetical protein ACJ8AW_16865 [Rhodopila sp.]
MRFVAWAALSLSVDVLTAIDATSSRAALLRLPAPSVFLDQSSIATLVVAVLGTTLSPYLFIWQSSPGGRADLRPAKPAGAGCRRRGQ